MICTRSRKQPKTERVGQSRRFSRFAPGFMVLASITLAGAAKPACARPDSLAEARRLVEQGKFGEAEGLLKELRSQQPDDAGVRFWLGRAALGAGHYALAEEALRSATAARPGWADAQYWLGQACEGSGDLGDAEAAYRAALSTSRSHLLARQALHRLAPDRPIEDPFPHHAVALSVEGNMSVDRQQVRVESPQVYDYTFTLAPSDWVMATGDWRVRSRWSCTPDWNFMGGESAQAAAIWNKREFVGDITVEAYMSYKMNVLGEGGYRNGTDFNITLCGDGRNLSSGYSFIVGGWGNSWTRILKGTEVLAETREPAHRPVTLLDGSPGSWAWHRRWWEMRAVKRQEYLYLFFDNELVLQAHDPDPLPGGRVALWTFDNGIIIPRAKIYYEDERQPTGAVPPYASQLPPDAEVPKSPPLAFQSETHPSIQAAFDHDLGGWAPRDGEHGARLLLDELTAGGTGRALRLVNRNSGGTFGATAIAGAFDAVKLNRLRFDYRIPPELRANIQLTAQGTRYEIVFTAPEYPSDRALRLADLPDVQADLKWHHVDLDLLACLRRFYPDAESIEVSDVWFGVDTVRDYILAGFGGNPAMCEYHIDDFAIVGAGGADGQVQITCAPSGEGEGPPQVEYDYLVDDVPDSTPDGEPEGADGVVSFAGLPDGVHYIHARTLSPGESPGPVYHHKVVVDTSGPVVVEVAPEPGSQAASEAVTVALEDPGSGVNPASVALRINDIAVALGAPGFAFDPVTGVASVDAARAGASFRQDNEVHVTVERAADWRGNELASAHEWVFAYDREQDEQPPAPPVVELPRAPLCIDTFEDGLGQWHNRSEGVPAALSLDDTTAASGKRSLRVYNPASGGGMGAVARSEPFDAGVYRLVSFDYKLRPEVWIDLYAVVNGTGYSIQFTNNDGANKIGEVADVQADDQWHHAEVNLYELLREARPSAPGYIVTDLMFIDAGSHGNIQHQYYNIDNFTITPVLSAAEGARLNVAAADVSGISGLSYLIDASPITEPPAAPTTRTTLITLAGLNGGPAWLHTRAGDEAGNWSQAAHQRLLVDPEPPIAEAAAPADGAATAVSEVIVNLTDPGLAGVDPRSIRLEVGGETYTVDNSGLVYDSSKGLLTWNCEETDPSPVTFANGQSVPVRLAAASDYAGNSVAQFPAWSWVMDYSKDTNAPQIASLRSTTHNTYLWQRFESGTEQVQKYGQKSSAKVELEASSPDGTGQSAKITNAADGGNMAFYLVTSSFSTASHPYLSFDYRISEGTTVDLFIYFYNETLVLQMTGNAGGYSATIPDIKADGQWHHCTFDLNQVTTQRASQRGLGKYYTISYVGVMHRDNAALPAGAQVNVDNVIVSAAGPKAATFAWSATDTTGIPTYSYLLDQSPNTEADQSAAGAEVQAQFSDLSSGVHYLHVRALDGAGNWGPTSHHAILVQ